MGTIIDYYNREVPGVLSRPLLIVALTCSKPKYTGCFRTSVGNVHKRASKYLRWGMLVHSPVVMYDLAYLTLKKMCEIQWLFRFFKISTCLHSLVKKSPQYFGIPY